MTIKAGLIALTLGRRGSPYRVRNSSGRSRDRADQLVLDKAPPDPGHLVALEYNDRIGHFELRRDFAAEDKDRRTRKQADVQS